MKQITAAEFKANIMRNPAWALTLTEPVEITDFCNMKDSGITHLSPLLHFTSRGAIGNCANFINCSRLKVAEGNFTGHVSFQNAGIQQIGQLNITQANQNGRAATFANCKHLKVAEGTFPGKVDFSESGVEKIGKLTILKPNPNGEAAIFSECENLKVAEGTFPGYVTFNRSGIRKIGRLDITQAMPGGYKFEIRECLQLQRLPAEWQNNPAVEMDEQSYKRLAALKIQRAAAGKAQRNNPEMEI